MLPAYENVADVSATQRKVTHPVHMSDQELSDLYASCMPSLKKAAKRMLRNPQDSEDILQEGLLSSVKNLHQFEGRSSFSTWLHSIVRNASRMYYRKNAGARMAVINLTPSDGSALSAVDCVADLRPSPEDLAICLERSDILKSVVRQLPAKQQAAFESFYVLGLGERDSSKHLGVTEASLKAQLHRSRRILTRRIRKVHMTNMHACSLKANSLRRAANVPRAPKGKNRTISSNSVTETSML